MFVCMSVCLPTYLSLSLSLSLPLCLSGLCWGGVGLPLLQVLRPAGDAAHLVQEGRPLLLPHLQAGRLTGQSGAGRWPELVLGLRLRPA